MIYRPCVFKILEDKVLVEFEDFIESIKREVLFYTGYSNIDSNKFELICKTKKQDGTEQYFSLKDGFDIIVAPDGDAKEIHKCIVEDLDLIKNQVLKHFGYVWV